MRNLGPKILSLRAPFLHMACSCSTSTPAYQQEGNQVGVPREGTQLGQEGSQRVGGSPQGEGSLLVLWNAAWGSCMG